MSLFEKARVISVAVIRAISSKLLLIVGLVSIFFVAAPRVFPHDQTTVSGIDTFSGTDAVWGPDSAHADASCAGCDCGCDCSCCGE